jgi:hypothetical protein
MRVVGLGPVEMLGIENYNVTEFVPGHMSYRQAMPRLLREVGWQVESDEFTEIEDPDPEDHGARQRELIDEIEEARKQLEKQGGEKETQQKSRFGFFASKKKKSAEKKEWETYDEKVRNGGSDDKDALESRAGGVLFDVDALRAEVAELAAQGIQVRELPESTLPPMRLDIGPPPGLGDAAATGAAPREPAGKLAGESESSSSPPPPPPQVKNAAAATTTTTTTSGEAKTAAIAAIAAIAATAAVGASASTAAVASKQGRSATLPEVPQMPLSHEAAQRPPLRSLMTAPAVPIVSLEHNAWVDEFEDDFGQEKDVSLTFE